jgi:hypothetical protein
MVAVGVVLAVAGTVEAGSPKGTQGRAERRVPLIRPGLDPDAVLKLGQAHALAKRRVETNAQCRALFTALGAAGEEKLAAAIYMQAPPEVVARRCRGGAAAAINPGTALTWVCPAFSSLKVQRAAMTLIHEALHSAGMLERPQTPDALSSAEINDLVRDSCGL